MNHFTSIMKFLADIIVVEGFRVSLQLNPTFWGDYGLPRRYPPNWTVGTSPWGPYNITSNYASEDTGSRLKLTN